MKTTFVILFTVIGALGYAQTWNNDIDFGLKQAAQTNKKVLLFFTVPEQCGNCSLLENNVLKSTEFLSFADKNYVLVKIDFRTHGDDLTDAMTKKNLLIVEKYNKDGFFPLVVVLNSASRVLGKIGVYNDETPSQFIRSLKSFEKS